MFIFNKGHNGMGEMADMSYSYKEFLRRRWDSHKEKKNNIVDHHD